MREYQFKVPAGVWLDVDAKNEAEAVKKVNEGLALLDEALPAPGPLKRVQVDNRQPLTKKDIVCIYSAISKRRKTPKQAKV
jgi:hypothetical protein